MVKMDNIPRIEEPITDASKWTTVKTLIRSGNLNYASSNRDTRQKICREILPKNHKTINKDSLKRHVLDLLDDPEVLRRLSLQEDSASQLALQEFMSEMIDVFSDTNAFNRTDSLKKIKGIMKNTINCPCNAKPTKPKNSVHFSEENIYFEIPRRRKHKFNAATEKCTHYCCFGFLFPT